MDGVGSMTEEDDATTESPPAKGVLVVRVSGAGVALAAMTATRYQPSELQLVMRSTLPRALPPSAYRLAVPGCSVEIRAASAEQRGAVVVLTVAAHRLSVDPAELQPLMFQQIPVARSVEVLFGASIVQLLALAANDPAEMVDRHGAGHYLIGLTELVLRSALHAQLNRADAAAARHRDAIDYVRRHLADPELNAERVARALFISRRRLYQLFDDGDGISGRIRQMRVNRAKELLADPTLAMSGIAELAKQCGFVNAAHFSRVFGKIVGQTPSEFRERSLRPDRSGDAEVDGCDQPPEHR